MVIINGLYCTIPAGPEALLGIDIEIPPRRLTQYGQQLHARQAQHFRHDQVAAGDGLDAAGDPAVEAQGTENIPQVVAPDPRQFPAEFAHGILGTEHPAGLAQPLEALAVEDATGHIVFLVNQPGSGGNFRLLG